MTTSAGERTGRTPRHRWPLFVACTFVLVVAACEAPSRVHVLGGQTMGTSWSVQAANLPAGMSLEELNAEVETTLERINSQMSTFREDSDITRFNQGRPGESFTLPEDFALVLASAQDLAAETGGAYDPTVGPLVDLWGFGPAGSRSEAPAAEELEAARARVGWHRLEFDEASRRLVQPGGIHLDLSSIAKGHAVDRIAERLEALGVRGYLVDIGGDLRVHGDRPDGSRWRIAIERPVAGTQEIHTVVEPHNVAVATSGGYRHFFIDQDRGFSHILDPRTGYPMPSEMAAVTVLHASCREADALATALGVLGPDEGYEFARRRNLAVLFLYQQNGTLHERSTPEFERLTIEDTR